MLSSNITLKVGKKLETTDIFYQKMLSILWTKNTTNMDILRRIGTTKKQSNKPLERDTEILWTHHEERKLGKFST